MVLSSRGSPSPHTYPKTRRKNVPKSHRIIDVTGDGSCFYRAVYQALKYRTDTSPDKVLRRFLRQKTTEYQVVASEDDFVKRTRAHIADVIEKKKDGGMIKASYKYIKSIALGDQELFFESYPAWYVRICKSLPASLRGYRHAVASSVSVLKNWAFDLDINVFRAQLKEFNKLKLHIFNDNVPLDIKFMKNTVYVINHNEVHYSAIAPNTSVPLATSPPKRKTGVDSRKKECPATHILNPKTGRCVSRTSCKGYEVIIHSRLHE